MATTKKSSSSTKKATPRKKTPSNGSKKTSPKKTTTTKKKNTSSIKKTPVKAKTTTSKKKTNNTNKAKNTSLKKKSSSNIKTKTSAVKKRPSTKTAIKNSKTTKKIEPKKEKVSFKLLLLTGILIAISGVIGWYYNEHLKYLLQKRNSKDIGVFKDVEPPIIECDDITITEGDKVNLLDYLKVTDNFDKKVNIVIIGNYDMNKAGIYQITFEATDSSKNKTQKDVKLIVKEKIVLKKDNIVYFTTSKGYKGYTKNGVTYINGILVVNKTYSLPSNYGNGLTSDAIAAFNEMKAAALTEGLTINVCSGFRSYSTQKSLYNNYVNRDGKVKADTYSARAGYSEHQSGLAMDINMAGDEFNNTPEAKWLKDNAYKYGFILRYPDGKSNETGYKYESWHYRYVGVDLATKLYNDGNWITMEEYFGIDSKYTD